MEEVGITYNVLILVLQTLVQRIKEVSLHAHVHVCVCVCVCACVQLLYFVHVCTDQFYKAYVLNLYSRIFRSAMTRVLYLCGYGVWHSASVAKLRIAKLSFWRQFLMTRKNFPLYDNSFQTK